MSEIGSPATLCYPQDTYGCIIVGRSPGGRMLRIEMLDTVSRNTGHEPAYYEGPFPVWHHEYAPEEIQHFRTGEIRSVPAKWVRIGTAVYHRNFSY